MRAHKFIATALIAPFSLGAITAAAAVYLGVNGVYHRVVPTPRAGN